MNAVLVEPSQFLRSLLTSLLNQAGFSVLHYNSGQEALTALPEISRPALLCLSLVTTDLEGPEVCRRLRELPLFKTLPMILVTSREDESVRKQAMSAGITEVFYKSQLTGLQAYLQNLAQSSLDTLDLQGRILYVEDSLTTAKVVMQWLEPFSLVVDHFESAEEALEAYGKGAYDLILADFMLKGKLSGLGLVREIRVTQKSRIPILILSALENPSRKIEILRSGASDFVAKPVAKEELLVRLRTLITNKRLWDELEEQKRLLTEIAMKDQLTQLYNRHSLIELAPKQVANARRHNHQLSLIVLDMDFFKTVNDTYGHQIGDLVLIQVAGLIREFLREGDYAARFGGEEFIVLMPFCDIENAARRAEDLRKLIQDLRPAGLTVSASLGVTSLSQDTTWHFEQLFAAGDQAAYKAKAAGRNRVEVFVKPAK